MKLTRRRLLSAGATAMMVGRGVHEAAAAPTSRSLRITGVETFAVRNPPPSRGGRVWVFVKILTDSGIVGYGEVDMLGISFRPPAVEVLIKDIVDAAVVGANPYQIERLYDKLYNLNYAHYPEFTKMGVISAIEMACWDIIGKDVGRPVYDLLGGAVRERVRTYTYTYGEKASHWTAMGFTAVKLDPLGRDAVATEEFEQIIPYEPSVQALDKVETTIREMREEVGNTCDILIGTHGQMTAAGAIRMAKRLEPYDPLWFEEPVPPENMTEMAKVARGTSIPICTGERLTTKYDFARLIECEAASIFNYDLGHVGGILEAKKIAGMAEAHYRQVSPHVWDGPIIAAASVQIAACCPNFIIMESIADMHGFHAELLKDPIEWNKGYITPSTQPGIGHELNEAVARKHQWS
jgi:galactonate dehydratase